VAAPEIVPDAYPPRPFASIHSRRLAASKSRVTVVSKEIVMSSGV
jgi:hypothetical protein